jgi:uncharacterized coiled-coil protein SlyX
MFMVLPTRSQTGSGQYDPWVDLNDDGEIDIYDAITLANAFNTAGTPINKTDLLLDLLARIESLNATVIQQQNTINNLNNTIVSLQSTTDYLNTTVTYLNDTVILLNGTQGLGAPDYDSGWVSVGRYVYLAHNLNTTDIIVYMIGRGASSSMSHQRAYGGDYTTLNNDHSYGAFWQCVDANTIWVYNLLYGYVDNWWESARVLVWKIPT